MRHVRLFTESYEHWRLDMYVLNWWIGELVRHVDFLLMWVTRTDHQNDLHNLTVHSLFHTEANRVQQLWQRSQRNALKHITLISRSEKVIFWIKITSAKRMPCTLVHCTLVLDYNLTCTLGSRSWKFDACTYRCTHLTCTLKLAEIYRYR